jgi:porphobilinogen synthase
MSIEIARTTSTSADTAGFPTTRLRRLRQHPSLRAMVRENELHLNDLILPLFVRSGRNVRQPISSMPGHAQLSVDLLAGEVREIESLGIPAVILFGIPEHKDAIGSESWDDDAGIVQQAIRAIRDASQRELLVIVDLCFCEYTDHGHCGPISERTGRVDVDNDATLENLARQATSLARVGADMIAPSGMMDGMVGAIRSALDAEGFEHLPIMSYAAKYASAFYGPFRQAADSAPQFGDRRSYQMDPANSDEAMREVELDIAEGADIVMVKPAMAYGDIIRRVKDRFRIPVAAYNVSGEFAMVKAAAERGWIDEQRITLEILTGIKRAGADMILTYFAKDVARWLSS